MARGARVGGWRKIAGSTWGAPTDPQFYGDLEVDAAAMLDVIDHVRHDQGVHLTPTHLVARAVAHALAQLPEVNGIVSRGRFIPRDSVDVFVIVATQGGSELTGVKVCDADRKTAAELAREVTARTAVLASGADPELGRAKAMFDRLPPRALRAGLRLAAFLGTDLGLDLRRLGIPRDTFGSALVSSVGMWGIPRAYAPLASYYRVPFLVTVGAVHPRATVVAGRVVARPMLTLTGTFDHRYVDGHQAARLARAISQYCHDPTAYEPVPRAVAVPDHPGPIPLRRTTARSRR